MFEVRHEPRSSVILSATHAIDAESSQGISYPVDERNVAQDERWIAVQRVIASKSFAKAARLSSFLLHVCERTLAGHTDELTEQQVGINVFGRAADYNPAEDNIVRGVARQVRQRLALYYQEEAPDELWRISIPRGAYIPSFDFLPATDETLSTAAAIHTPIARPATQAATAHWRLWFFSVLLFLSGVLTTLAWQHRRAKATRKTPTSPLWSEMFTLDRRTVIAAGDAGLFMYDNLLRKKVPLSEYGTRIYLNNPIAVTPYEENRSQFVRFYFTSFPDAVLISKLVQRPELVPSQLDVRFARDLNMNDLKESNVILIGSESYNPWIQIFRKDLNFTMDWDAASDSTTINNAKPAPGEQAIYRIPALQNPNQQEGYALIDFINPSRAGNKALIVQGTTTLGLDAAISFITSETEFAKVIQQAQNSDGTLKGFEVLLHADFVSGNLQDTRVVATRIYHQSTTDLERR